MATDQNYASPVRRRREGRSDAELEAHRDEMCRALACPAPVEPLTPLTPPLVPRRGSANGSPVGRTLMRPRGRDPGKGVERGAACSLAGLAGTLIGLIRSTQTKQAVCVALAGGS